MRIDEFLLARIAEDEQIAAATTDAGATTWRYEFFTPEQNAGRPWSAHVVALDPTDAARGFVVVDIDGEAERLAEEAFGEGPRLVGTKGLVHIAHHDPARVLAECAAKRRIIARHAAGEFADAPGEYYCTLTPTWGFWPCADLLDLAQPYSTHPDFDPAWGTTQV